MEELNGKQVILFDGVCNLCNGSVQFVIKRDKKDMYRFAALQSNTGQKLVQDRKIDPSKVDSIILIQPNIAFYIKSSAALKIGKSFGGGYILLGILEWIPSQIRDWVYDFIAKRRYRWFGRQDTCMIPSQELKAKFLD